MLTVSSTGFPYGLYFINNNQDCFSKLLEENGAPFSFVEDSHLWIIFLTVLSINAKFQFEPGRYHSSSVYILLQPALYSKLTVNQEKPLSVHQMETVKLFVKE